MFRPPNAFGAPPPFPPQPQPWQWQQPPPPSPSPSPSPAVTFWQRDNVRDHVRKLQQTVELSTALIKELEEIAAVRNSGDAATQESASSSVELPSGSGDSSEDKPLRFVELARSMGISLDTHESMATDVANYLCHQLQHLLGPISSVTSQTGPWEGRSAMVRLTQKLQKSKRNKRWRKRRRKHVAELFQKEHADYDRINQEADEWRAKQIAKDIAKRKVESMQQIARKKANEERKRLESELELALMVEKLQELRSIRVQKMKKQGHFLPEEDDKYLERVKAAVEEEERQAAFAARTDAVKDAILTAEESRKPPQNANSQGSGSEQPSGPSEDMDLGDGGINERNDQASQKTEHEDEDHRFEGKGHEHHDPVSSLPFEFYHYYHGSSYDMGTLMEVRRMWDSFIRPGGRIGKEELMVEDYGDAEIEYELAPVSAQLAYVQQLQGQHQEAMQTYVNMINGQSADPSSLVATTNLISLKGTKDTADSLKKLDRLIGTTTAPNQLHLVENLDFKLSPRQKEALFCARVLLLLHANKTDQAHELVSGLLGMFPDSVFPVLLQAAVHVKEKKVQKAEDVLSQYAEKHPENSKGLLLALAQIAANANHLQLAADSLSRIPDIQHMPATVATLVALKERLGDSNAAASVLDSAIHLWKNSMTEDNKLDILTREAAAFKLSHGRDEEACLLYEELVKSHGSVEALAGLVMTSAHTNLEKAEQYEKKLKPLSGLKGVNVESLEKTSGARHVEGPQDMKVDVPEEVKKLKAKKRKRKPRYPKGFDPANPGPPPDPERWLPRRERSSYRPKKKDKMAQVRGAQGAVSRETSHRQPNAGGSSKGSQTTSSSKTPATNTDQPKASNKSRKKSRS